MKWTGKYRTLSTDTDLNNIVSPTNLLRYMQDSAFSEMKADGESYDDLFSRGLSFVLSRMRVSFYAPVRANDELECQTWTCESRGVQFNRCYRVLRSGIIVAEAVSVWALIGTEDRKLHRVSELGPMYCEDEMLELDMPARFRIPEDVSLSLMGEKTVCYPDADLNGHMNNTRYADMLCGFACGMQGRRLISMGISYVSEAPLDETLKVYVGSGDGTYYVRTVRPDGRTNAEAELIFENLE
jgi:acyl-CoA thioesterase FadM